MVASRCIPGPRAVEIHHKPVTRGLGSHVRYQFTPYATSVHIPSIPVRGAAATEHIANSRCNDNRNSTLSQRIRHSNVTATPIATHAPGTAGDSTQWVQVIASPPTGNVIFYQEPSVQ